MKRKRVEQIRAQLKEALLCMAIPVVLATIMLFWLSNIINYLAGLPTIGMVWGL